VLRLAVARALLRRPALLVVEDCDAFAEALGDGRLPQLLRRLRGAGTCVVGVAPGAVGGAVRGWEWADVRAHLQTGSLTLLAAPSGGTANSGS
jgi:hypothetical protein